MRCRTVANLKRDWCEWEQKEKKMNICWCRKVCFVFQPGSRRGKVWNLIKPSSGGASLIRDPPNKRRVPRENNIYMLQHGPSLHLDSCSARGREPPYWKQLRRFKSGPRQRSPAQRGASACQISFPAASSPKLPQSANQHKTRCLC